MEIKGSGPTQKGRKHHSLLRADVRNPRSLSLSRPLVLHLQTEPVAQRGEIPAPPELLGDTRAFSCKAAPFSGAFLHMERDFSPLLSSQAVLPGRPSPSPRIKNAAPGLISKTRVEKPLGDAFSHEKALLEQPGEWDCCMATARAL